MRNTSVSLFLLDVQAEGWPRAQDEIANRLGIAQNSVGRLQFMADFRRLESAFAVQTVCGSPARARR